MKHHLKPIFVGLILSVMLSGCANRNESTADVSVTEPVQSSGSSETVSETSVPEPLPQNGELTKALGESLSAAFADGSYYFKSTFKMRYPNPEDDYIGVSICHADGEREYDFCCNFGVEQDEAAKTVEPVDGLLHTGTVTYQLYTAEKKAEAVEKDMLWGWVPLQYGKESIPHPKAVFSGVGAVEEDGGTLVCETFEMKTYMNTTHKYDYYYMDGIFVKLVEEYFGEEGLDTSWISEVTMEYSSEPDESLLTIPEDYEIIN